MSPIIPPILFFVLSLIGAYVLFKILKARATIKEPTKQLGGAMAGFVILFGMLTGSYYFLRGSVSISEYNQRIEEYEKKIREIKENCEPQEWIVSGYIVKENSTGNEGINVNYIPPSPGINFYPVEGRFRLHNVRILRDQWPILQFSCDGYYPEDYKITPENADIKKKEKSIQLRDKIHLTRINQEGGEP